MLLLLYCLQLLSKFDRGMVCNVVMVILYIITVDGLIEEWFILLFSYCLPLLFLVWQKSASFCCCYIVYYYSLRFDSEVVHVVVILSTISVRGLTEEWFMLLLFCLPLLFKVWQRSRSYCCFILYHYCFRFHRGMVCNILVVILYIITVKGSLEEWFMLLLFYCLPYMFKVWQRSCSCCCCYIVFYYCVRFDRGVVHVVNILSTITV